MAGPREYLAVLSKVMRENRAENGLDKNSYDDLYLIVHSELNEGLKASLYPEAPALTQKINHMLDDMEPLFLCGEMVGKACLLLSNYRTNELFSTLSGVFLEPRFAGRLRSISTQIPFVVTHGDTDSIEALNYANQRVSLSLAEYQLLVTESGKNRVALNRIVQVFLIQTPLKREDACLIFDNIYQTAERIFGRAVCKRVICVDQAGLKTVGKREPSRFDATLCDAGLEEELSSTIKAFRDHPFIKKDGMEDYLNNCVSPILYGFRDEFRSLATQIESYYLNVAEQEKAAAQEIVSDIVRLGAEADRTLSSIRSASQVKAKAIQKDHKRIHDILARAEACVIQAESALNDTASPQKAVPRRVYDDIFSGLFESGRNYASIGRDVLSRLTTLEYDDCELVAAYIQSMAGQTVEISRGPVKKGEWEKAKMLIEIADLDHLPRELIREYVDVIGKARLVTGKECYAKALLADEIYKATALQESFVRGYAPAGEALLERYKQGDRQVNLQTLSNALVPEACMMMADRQETTQYDQDRFVNLSDERFAYYKIAAARGHLPAVGNIVDAVYQSRFAQAYQLHGDQREDPRFEEMIENGDALCELCYALIDKMYQVKHFSEILGVVLFSLNKNLSDAMSLLSGIDTGVANYCKGNMYEFGNGVAWDLDQAALHYQRAWDQGFQSRQLERRLSACQEKRRQKDLQREDSESYREDVSYRPQTSNYSSHSSSCVITTAACQALNAGDDCEELMLLRWFRDTHLENTGEGEAIVREYYRVGSLITEQISRTGDPCEMYHYLWEQYIRPSCAAIRAEEWDTAKSIYIQMVKGLCEKYGIQIRPQINEALKNSAQHRKSAWRQRSKPDHLSQADKSAGRTA